MQNASRIYIPEILISLDKLEEREEQGRNPILFIRLNRNGTAIDTDELIYSYYKSIYPDAKKMVENVIKGYLSPKKILNIFSRLANFKGRKKDDRNYFNGYTLQSFRSAIMNDEITLALNDLIKNGANKLELIIQLFQNFEHEFK